MKKYYYIFAFFLLTLLSCKNLSEPKENFFDSVKIEIQDTMLHLDTTTSISHKDNTFIVEKRSIIFFMPTKEERKDIDKQYGNFAKWDLQEIFNRFQQLAKSSKRNLSKSNFKIELTTDIVFKIEMDTSGYVVFNRKKEDQLVGIIFSDGIQEPVIKFGVLKRSDILEIVSNFFNEKYEDEEVVDTTDVQERIVK